MNLVEGYAYSASKVMINNKKCKLGRTAPENYAHEQKSETNISPGK